MSTRFGEYAEKGDYHLELDPSWPYLPVYLAKMSVLRRFMQSVPKDAVIYDMGCGEGALVKEFRLAGYNIQGMDINYASEFVTQRNFLESQLPAQSVDLILCLDVLEHLFFPDQEKAIAEFERILKPGGYAMISVPNLAHFASRLSFLVRGKLIRTSSIERHPGDRPAGEYLHMFSTRFKILWRKGIFPTFPIISLLTLKAPAKSVPLHRLYNALFPYPNWCFLNIFLLQK
jgi:predicted SAM-dependent methyltransferase